MIFLFFFFKAKHVRRGVWQLIKHLAYQLTKIVSLAAIYSKDLLIKPHGSLKQHCNISMVQNSHYLNIMISCFNIEIWYIFAPKVSYSNLPLLVKNVYQSVDYLSDPILLYHVIYGWKGLTCQWKKLSSKFVYLLNTRLKQILKSCQLKLYTKKLDEQPCWQQTLPQLTSPMAFTHTLGYEDHIVDLIFGCVDNRRSFINRDAPVYMP